LRQKQKKLIMLPSEIMIWQPEFTDKILSRKPGAVQLSHGVGFQRHGDWKVTILHLWQRKLQSWYSLNCISKQKGKVMLCD
ncbi:hypothetical protein, partial [Escherichia coli]|uniref:hypothetical protein n=3 Tax=Escherichia coli TaxID=562 RepID=UPI001A7E1313